MEKHLRLISGYSQATTVTILLSLLLLTNLVNGVTEQELDTAIAALTSNGYHLFGNAISTSDLRYQIIAGNNFTFFAPTNSDLYSLDMESDASDYVQNLRYHVAVHRLAISDLNNLPPLSFINTMIPNRCLLISNNQITTPNGIFNGSFAVDGVPISVPDLYTGSSISIHGLDGILALKIPETMNSDFDDIDLGSLSPSFQSNKCFSSFSPRTMPDSVTPASSPDPFPKSASYPDPFSVSSASSPAPFSVWTSSSAPFSMSASSPASVSTSKENADELNFKKKREKRHEHGHRRKKNERKKVQDRRRHIDDEEVQQSSFYK
ncbi:FAS1 domain [Macleaya cordata]|uniref:FAS1 domain n=1 Tax=Macleaya cordata TaxID=56857 RepID=A0A200PPW5_MACCD|nr:FAS1 domain [Macleaya cordata]